jgi:hypothetical protein
MFIILFLFLLLFKKYFYFNKTFLSKILVKIQLNMHHNILHHQKVQKQK